MATRIYEVGWVIWEQIKWLWIALFTIIEDNLAAARGECHQKRPILAPVGSRPDMGAAQGVPVQGLEFFLLSVQMPESGLVS